MNSRIAKNAKRVALIVVIVLLTALALRAWDSQRRPPLEPWHTYVPHELSVEQIDRTDWSGYLKAEAAISDEVRREVTDKLPEHHRVPSNRYFAASPVYPGHFAQDWNSATRACRKPIASCFSRT